MKVVFCWTHISGYMAACWRALAEQPDIELSVLAFTPARQGAAAFDPLLMQDIPSQLLDETKRQDIDLIQSLIDTESPDVLVIPGWAHQPYVQIAKKLPRERCKLVMGMDTPWKGTWRQRLAPWRLRSLLKRVDHVVVAGTRAKRYALRLGLCDQRITVGVYGYDNQRFDAAFSQRALQQQYPQRFLYVGRLAPEKGLDTLVDAYRMYRNSVENPWPMTCCGRGPMGDVLRSCPGIEDRGFVQPDALPGVYLEHGVFVLPSRYEPWGVVVAEALGSGTPVICTQAVGATEELVRPHDNGLVVPSDNPAALAQAMRWMHDHAQQLPELGSRGHEMAGEFSAAAWALRWNALLRHLVNSD